jgi:hypothetical protein
MATELTPYQKDILVKTILSEARGEGADGMAAVAHVIANRANSGQFSSDPAAVALQPNQFSGWNTGEGGNNPSQFTPGTRQYNQALQIIDNVFSGQTPDPTNGALYYHTPAVNPSWSGAVNRYGTNQIGNHIFYNGRPTPPGEIPNQVASLTDTIAPRVAPTPATSSPDLAMMRNPVMSSSARMAQVTPPLPQRRPASPMDIARAPGATVATIPTIARPGQSQIERNPRQPSAREIAAAPGVTVATIPTSGVGLPPTTRVVQSVPNPMQPTAREIAEARGTTVATIPTASASQVQQAARRAALTANQSYVDRAPPSSPITPPMAMNMGSRDSVANTALGQRVAAQTAPAFKQPAGWTPTRLAPNPIVQPSFVPLNQPPIQVVPNAQQQAPRRVAPMPMQASARPLAPALVPQRVPQMAPQKAPLRIVVNGGNQVASALATQPVAQQPMTVVQALRSQGLSPSDAYAVANQRAKEQAYERANGPDTRSDYFKSVTGG